jgi:hypothetical protein
MKNGKIFECPEGAGGGVGEPGFPAIYTCMPYFSEIQDFNMAKSHIL